MLSYPVMENIDMTNATKTTRIARITGLLFANGEAFNFPAELGEVLIEEIVEAPAPPAAEPTRLARGSTPPPVSEPTERSLRPLTPAPVRQGGFRADLADVRLKGRRVLVRKHEGKVIRVDIDREAGGFRFDGKLWPSLSSIARTVCGHNRNGFEFFGLSSRGRS